MAESGAGPLWVGVTGGIASGKSALTAAFDALGVPVADADVAARAVVEPGSPALAEIAAAFGARMLDGQGRLDRRRLRERVFADASARKRLEAIVHPRVRAWMRQAAAGWTSEYGLLVIPLLAENQGDYRWLDRVLVVDVPESLQIQRLMRRDAVDQALAQAMVSAQATREQRLAIADDVHDGSGSIEALPERAAALHERYRVLARQKREGELPPPRIRTQD